jgi:UDP-glucose 4-epimerase
MTAEIHVVKNLLGRKSRTDPYATVSPLFAGDDKLRTALSGKRVLVAGADGFLGFNAARGLHAMGAHVTLAVRSEVARAAVIADEVHSGDLVDADFVNHIVEGQDIVIDMVGYPNLAPHSIEPVRDFSREFLPHTNLFYACAKSPKSPVVVHASTRLVYGPPQYLPVDENHPTRPTSVYGAHKLSVEHYLRVIKATHGLRYVIHRVSSPFGPGSKPGRDGFGVLNLFMRRAVEGDPLVIYGEGDQTRDYIFIDDCIHAMLWTAVIEECLGEAYNLGGNRDVSLAEAATLVARLGGVEVNHVPWPPDALAVETGSYQGSQRKLLAVAPLQPQLPFEKGAKITMKEYARGNPPKEAHLAKSSV